MYLSHYLPGGGGEKEGVITRKRLISRGMWEDTGGAVTFSRIFNIRQIKQSIMYKKVTRSLTKLIWFSFIVRIVIGQKKVYTILKKEPSSSEEKSSLEIK